MIVLGADAHKRSHTIAVVEAATGQVERKLLDWAELPAARAVSVYRPLFEPGGGV